jgi:hypothetical protein
MKTSGVVGVVALALAVLTWNAMAQRGGVARGGVRGAAVGGLIGGDSAAQAGAVIGATRGAVNRVQESQARTQYQTTAAYQSAPRSNFNEVPPPVLVPTTTTESVPQPPVLTSKTGAAAADVEAVISKNGKAVIGMSYPADWKQKTGTNYVTAVSPDGQAWSVLASLEGIANQEGGIERAKQGLEKYLKDVKYDDPVKTLKGALVITGSGKGMKNGVPVVFAAGILDAGEGQLAGAAFLVDENVEEHYKEAVRHICGTVRLAKDLTK